ncbi:MAG: YezD family protein [Acidobacteria bacterium]|nr:YezD family protein [Acidobacteriota bacterium]
MARTRDDDEARCAGQNKNAEVEAAILAAVRSLRYGSVEVVVHDCRVVQIERKEKTRFEMLG